MEAGAAHRTDKRGKGAGQSVVGATDSVVIERWPRGLSSCRSGVLTLFQYPFHPRVTAVASRRSWSFCPKCSWQVTAKIRMHLTYVA